MRQAMAAAALSSLLLLSVLLLLLLLPTVVRGFTTITRSPRAKLASSIAARHLTSGRTMTTAPAPLRMLLNGGWGNPFAPKAAAPTSSRRSDGLDTEVVICGTGIAGLALAADLERRGIDYLVVEKAR
jgi:hypothetical protein